MKVSDYIAKFLAEQGVEHCFVLTGGCIAHLLDSVANRSDIEYIPMHHEQSCAMAADAYARITGNIGIALATSGPGATNLLTGTCCSYYDSIPVITITGQVPTNQLKRQSKSRQIGFQETDVVSIFKPITKYATLIDDPSLIRYELEKAFYLAREGRPGPVLLDICDDVQRAEINPAQLRSFTAGETYDIHFQRHEKEIGFIFELINQSARPVFIFGGGVRSSGATSEVATVVEKLNIPFTLTWGAMDVVAHDHPLYTGGFGVTSGRPGNFAVQNADLIIAIGTRLDTHEVGSNIGTFARAARKIIIDIDPAEQVKYEAMGMSADVLLTVDAKEFIKTLIDRSGLLLNAPSRRNWHETISNWKHAYPICLEEYKRQPHLVNPYVFVEKLAKLCDENAIIITDCGSNLIWTMQAFKIRTGQRLISAFNHSPMGYSLPASIGASISKSDNQIVCIIGDGGLQVNVQELGVIHRNKLNIKIFVLNNHCHGIIQGTQDNWLGGRHHASCPSTGKLPDCNVDAISEAYGLKSLSINTNAQLEAVLSEILMTPEGFVCNVHLSDGAQIFPKLLYGRPIEDSHPLLPRDEFHRNMIVAPIT